MIFFSIALMWVAGACVEADQPTNSGPKSRATILDVREAENERNPSGGISGAADGPHKPEAALDVEYRISNGLAPSAAFEVELAIIPRRAAEWLTVEVTGMEGIELLDGASARFASVEAGERYTARVSARADDDGIYYLGVVAELISEGRPEGRALSVKVVVGEPVSASPVRRKGDLGTGVVSMQAIETIEETDSPGRARDGSRFDGDVE